MSESVEGPTGGWNFLRPAIDTLPVHLAILDAEGTILVTNRAWREFARANGMQTSPDTVGVNYLEVADAGEDANAARAAEGIRDLLRGEREQFELEYPCHSPDTKRWFLMWASSFTDGEDRYVTVAHLDITPRKRRERALECQRDELAQLQRVNTLVREITQALQDATTRATIETAVCERLTGSDLYRAVWIGTRGGDIDECPTVVPRASAGVDGSYLDALPDGERGLPERALRTGKVQVVNDVATANEVPDERRERALEHDLHALAAVPLAARGTTYGVLVVYVPRGDTIGTGERDVLADLGRSIALAIQRVHSRRSLVAETGVALELRLPDTDSVLGTVSAELDCELVLERRVSTDDGTTVYFLTVRGAAPDEVFERLTSAPSVTEGTVVRGAESGRPAVLEVHFEGPSRQPLAVLTDFGASVTTERAVEGDLLLGVELPPEVNVRTVLEALREDGAAVELVSKQHVDRPAKTMSEMRDEIRDALTAKQEATLKAAYARGYYTWPRDSTMEELAETFDVSAPTLHYRLRMAHQTVIGALFDDGYGNQKPS